jgi:hypothetical protein
MNPIEDNFIASRIERISPILAGAVVIMGVLISIGWAFDVEFLCSGFPGLPATKIEAALAIIICGAPLCFSHRMLCVHMGSGGAHSAQVWRAHWGGSVNDNERLVNLLD